jgi:putative transposase
MAQMALSLPLPIPVAAPQRVLLPNPDDQAIAESRLATLQMVFECMRDPQRFGRLELRDGTPVTSATRMLRYAAESADVSERTVKEWLARYRKSGLPGLADKQRSDRGTSRFFAAYPKAAWLAAYLFLECKASVAVCHEAILRDAALLEIDPDSLPSRETVRAWLRSMPPSLVVYARKGRKEYRERMSPFLSRGHAEYANQIWIADHALHDVECFNDCFEDAEWGEPIRVRISAFLDDRSRLLMGATWCWEGSSRGIAAAMRRGILRYGPPEHCYFDNGKDYRKAAKGALPGYLRGKSLAPDNWWRKEIDSIAATGFLARLNIAITHCIPHHPQSKAIERWFGGMHERFDKLWPTYTSGSPFTRPDSTEAAMMTHRRLLKAGRVDESKHPLASRFVLACLAWIEEYNETPHSGENMNNCSPREVFEANLNPRQKPTPDYPTLALLMAEHAQRKILECTVTLGKRRYDPIDQAGWADMHRLNDCDVLVAYDAVDLENVAVLDLDGNFVAWLQSRQLTRFAPGDPATQQTIAESMATRRRLENGNREAIAIVTRAARANGALSPLEAMATRLQLASGETGLDIVTQRAPKPRLRPNKTAVAPASASDIAALFLEELK